MTTTDKSTPMFSDAALAEAAKYPTLGPSYFEARAIVERQMASFEAAHFGSLLKDFATRFYEKLREDVQSHLMGDTELNLQGEMYRMVDASVAAILTGERWAIERYALHKYDGEKVRKAVAAHIPRELQDARVSDLEAENARLRDDLKFYRTR